MEAAFNELAQEVLNYDKFLREILTYIENDAYGDIDMKLGHFGDIQELAKNPKVWEDKEAIKELLVQIGDAISAEHHSELSKILTKMTAQEERLVNLSERVMSSLPQDSGNEEEERESDDEEGESDDDEDCDCVLQ